MSKRELEVYQKIKALRESKGIKVDPNNVMDIQVKTKKKSPPTVSYEEKVLSSVKYSKQITEKDKKIDKLFEDYNNRIKNNEKVSLTGLCKEYKLSVPTVVSIFQKSGMLTNHKHIIYSYNNRKS